MNRILTLCVMLIGFLSASVYAQTRTVSLEEALEIAKSNVRESETDLRGEGIERILPYGFTRGKDGRIICPKILERHVPKRVNEETGETVYRVVETEREGQLAELLGEQANELDSLVVSGPINDDDFETMWSASFYGNLKAINLKDARPEKECIPDTAFYRSIQLPEDPFYGPDFIPIKLQSIILPTNIKEIGKESFFLAAHLENITLPESIEKIGERCFTGTIIKGNPLKLPKNLREVENHVFEAIVGTTILDIDIPDKVRRIGDFAFKNSRIGYVNLGEGLEEMGEYCFNMSEVKEITFPPTFSRFIGDSQFFWCRSLSKLHMAGDVEFIPDFFCLDCNKLEDLKLPPNLVEIGSKAFAYCYKINDIEFPKTLRRIGPQAFYSCFKIKTLILPSTLEYLGNLCFNHCGGIESIYCESPFPPECEVEDGNTPFGNYYNDDSVSRDVKLYVPTGSAGLYCSAKGWDYFRNVIEIDPEDFPEAGVEKTVFNPNSSDCPIYDLNGTRIAEPQPGRPYIRNGKTFMVTE